jgi:rhamnogalacturonyl hydrolase YesR
MIAGMMPVVSRFAACLLIAIFSSGVFAALSTLPVRDSVLAKVTYVDKHFIKRWPTSACNSCLSGNHAGNIWTRGAYFEGHMALYRMTLDTGLYNYAIAWGNFFGWAFNGGNSGTNANGECAGQTYAELYQTDTAQKIRLLSDTAYVNAMKNTAAVNYWTWVDAIHMAMPVFARVGVIRKDTAAYSKMYKLFEYPKSTLHYWDTVSHLWFRDSTFMAPKYYGPHGLPCFWSRGNGWAMGALCRTLDYLPADNAHWAEYVQIIQQMAAALKAIQRADGFWNVDLGDPNNYGGPEETGTGFFVYAMAWGINHGILDTSTYLPALAKGWNAMVDSCIHPNTDSIVLGYVQGSGDQPSSSQPVGYNVQPNFDDYGVGIFLLAGSEVYKLAPNIASGTRNDLAISESTAGAGVTVRNNILRISNTGQNEVGIEIFDVTGRSAFMIKCSGAAEIRLPSMLGAGVYLLRVKRAEEILLKQAISIIR